jgi:ATP-dependent helicase/nuclease subunit B
MQVVFGWNLDGPCFPETVSGSATFNSAVVGPRGLLGLLETKLGLRRPAEPTAVRVAQYLALLKKVDDGSHYFSKSLTLDPWATANKLLQARDELVGAGWDRKPIATMPKLASLAAVEAAGTFVDGMGERIAEVLQRLEEAHAKKHIEELRIVGNVEWLPRAWQKLITTLSANGTRITELARATRSDDGADLAVLKHTITTRDTAPELRGDGSFTVIDADDELQAAEMTAAWLARHPNHRDIVLIRGADSSALNQACARYGLPHVGNTVRSEFRAILQVLQFAFEMAWRPIDPKRMAEFITLDGGPMPWAVSYELLPALAEEPGIGGPRWQEAWKNLIKREVEDSQRSDAALPTNQAERQAKEKVANWQKWFEARVHSMNAEMRIDDAIDICAHVQKWATARGAYADEDRLYELAARHAYLLSNLLAESGQETIGQTQLRKMVAAVTGYGVSVSSAECAEWTIVDAPGQIWNSAKTIVWWQFAQPVAQSVRLSAWSSDEIEELARHDIYIDTPLQRLRRESHAWREPIINASERLVIVKPQMVAGQDAIPHPLWDDVESLFDEKSLHKADMFGNPKIQFAGIEFQSDLKMPVVLPRPHRNWVIPEGIAKAREKNESFSSIDKLLGCSLAWVLEYHGNMRQPKQLDLAQKDLLIGKLAHAVIDELYTQKKRWQPEEARQKTKEILEEFIPQRAAPLLLPGGGPQLRQAMEAIPSAVEHLTRVLNEANVRVDGTEISLEAKFSTGRGLGGNADMVAYTADNHPMIIDFKWAASPGWYRKKIVQGQSMQLAIYAYLALQMKGASAIASIPAEDWPPVGYFMLRGKEMFFTKDGIFPRSAFVKKQARTLKETWELTVKEYERELAEIIAGRITAYGVDHDSAELEDFMNQRLELTDPPCRFCNLGYICGKREIE